MDFCWGRYWDPYFFITYINDFPLSINTISDAIMFANDTRIVTANKNFKESKNTFNIVLSHITK
jgi:hypothetical protein